MGYPTASTAWPSTGISTNVKQLIDHFFSLVDNKADDSGQKIAKEVFTDDGKFFATSGNFEGSAGMNYVYEVLLKRLKSDVVNSAEIAKSRATAWESVSSRRHELAKVYGNDTEGLDLIMIGALTVEKEGAKSTHEFVARCLLDDSNSRKPRIRHYQVLIPTLKDSHMPILNADGH